MSTPPPSDRAARGPALLAARVRRIALLRRRVFAATLATFALAWGAIVWQGSLGKAQTAQVTRTTTTTATAAATATPDTSTASPDDLTTGQS
jgi:hypothetical protein